MNSRFLHSIPLDLGLSQSEYGQDCQETFCLDVEGEQTILHRVQFKQRGYHLKTNWSTFVAMAKVIISLITPSRGRHVYSPLRKHKFAVHFHLLCKCSCVCTMTSVCVSTLLHLFWECVSFLYSNGCWSPSHKSLSILLYFFSSVGSMKMRDKPPSLLCTDYEPVFVRAWL